MALITWKDAFKCGDSSVDHEHEELINLINNMHVKVTQQCSAETIRSYLSEIHALIEAHFALEEKIMRDNRFEGYTSHKEDHDKLLEDIRDIMEGVIEEVCESYEKNLADSMSRWFGVHFVTFDKDFHQSLHC